MLDPFSCLAIATAIAQFVDFGSELLILTQKIHRGGGSLASLQNLEQDTQRFKQLVCNLPRPKKGEDAEVRRDGHELVLEGQRCSKLADQIIDFLKELNIEGNASRLKSLKLAFKIEMRTKQLDEFQKQILDRKVALTLQLVKVVDSRQSSVYTMLDKLRERDIALETALTTKLDDIKAELVNMSSAAQAVSGTTIQNAVACFDIEAKAVAKTQYLISSLQFDAIRARERAISANHAKTFEWILNPSQSAPFFDWLRKRAGLFWVSGKAGSGKSTLLKFVYEHAQTRQILQEWAGDAKLVMSRYFFWNAGTPLQKSHVGLIRSLCYDVFRSCPDLMPIICADRYAVTAIDKCLDPDFVRDEHWSLAELSSIIDKLSKSGVQSSGRNVKFCFFIDGLDEYAGDHDDIIKYIDALARLPNIKICVSSRPWNVFEIAFSGLHSRRRMLVLQDLSRGDIVIYVKGRLGGDARFKRVLTQDQRCASLVQEITDRADGVFLWVYLVVNELLKSLTNDDGYHTLQRRLHRMPPGLEPYFQHMFDTLDDFYQVETAQIFRVCVEAPYYVPVLAFTVLEPHDPLAARIANDVQSAVDAEQRRQMEGYLRNRILGRCRDLLEIQDRKVSFLHRSVKDFLSTQEMIALLDSRTGNKFELDRCMCHVSLVGLRYLSFYLESSAGDRSTLTWLVPSFYHHAREVERKTKIPAMDILDLEQALLSDIHDAWAKDLPDESELLAMLNLPLALQARLPQQGKSSSTWLANRLCDALEFLTPSRQYDSSEDKIYDSIFALSWEKDPDRHSFDPTIVSMLAYNGADPNKTLLHGDGVTTPWIKYLEFAHCFRDCDPATKSRILQFGAELIKAGAKPASALGMEEDVLLAIVFGHADAQWLSGIRDVLKASRNSWSPFRWLRR